VIARLLSVLVASVAAASAASPAFAHGGQYQPPGGKGGGIPPDALPDPRVPEPTPPGRATMTPWERWWDANRFRLFDLRGRIRMRDARGATVTPDAGDRGDGDGPAAPPPPRRAQAEREALPVVTAALSDDDAEVRSAAALALGRMGFPRSLLDLTRAARDPVRDVREAAVLALGMVGDPFAVEPLREILLDPNADERARGYAALGLGLLGGAEASDALAAYLDPASDAKRAGGLKRRPETTACVVASIGLAGGKAAAPVLRKIALEGRAPWGGNAEPAVRSFALAGLARLGDRELLAPAEVLPLLEEDREALRQGACVALGLIAGPDDGPILKALEVASIGDRDRNVRALASMALARVGGDGARAAIARNFGKCERVDLPFAALAAGVAGAREAAGPMLQRYREEKDPATRGALAIGLGLLRARDAAPDLRVVAFGGGPRPLRIHALTALGLMEDAASAEPMRELVRTHPDHVLRGAASVALGLLGDPDAVPLLQEAAKRASTLFARGHACRWLGVIGDPRSGRLLARIASNRAENPFVRMYAVTGLGTLHENSDAPRLAPLGFDLDSEQRIDALDEVAGYM
jgi:HEAT repeat protein